MLSLFGMASGFCLGPLLPVVLRHLGDHIIQGKMMNGDKIHLDFRFDSGRLNLLKGFYQCLNIVEAYFVCHGYF